MIFTTIYIHIIDTVNMKWVYTKIYNKTSKKNYPSNNYFKLKGLRHPLQKSNFVDFHCFVVEGVALEEAVITLIIFKNSKWAVAHEDPLYHKKSKRSVSIFLRLGSFQRGSQGRSTTIMDNT